MNLGMLGSDIDPEKTAFVSLPQNRHYTYGDIQSISDTVAAGLSRKYQVGDRIAVIGLNSADYIATVLGIMKAGMVAVPVNWKLPDAQIRDVLNDAGVKQVFSDDENGSAVPDDFSWEPLCGTERQGFLSVDMAGKEPALILYTSGSTGRPKGVVLSHESHVWTAQTRKKRTSLANDVTLIAAPLYHMQALTLAFLVLASGGTAVILPRFRTADYLKAIETYSCTYITAVPPMIEAVLRDPLVHDTDLSSVTTVRLGSAPAGDSLFGRIGKIMPQANIVTSYGTTESGPVTFTSHPEGKKTPPFSAGYPHPDVSVRLNDHGVLEIKSPALMNGYYNRPEIRPFTEDGYYITGDVFSLDEDGFYTFKGRADDMFVCGGENIYPGEVEKVLGTHPLVQNTCVVPVDDDIKGKKPVAYVVKKGNVTEEELKRFVLAHAAPYLHPRRVWFVDQLPVTDTNKINRKLLMADAAKRLSEENNA